MHHRVQSHYGNPRLGNVVEVFGSTRFAGLLAGILISPGLKPAGFFEALPQLAPCLDKVGSGSHYKH